MKFKVITGAILLWSAALSAGQALPTLELPPLTGPYKIGVIRYDLIDQSRLEDFTPGPTDRRQIGLQIWYPSQAVPERSPPGYLDGVSRQTLIENKVPPAIIPALRALPTRAIPNAPQLSNARPFPVLVFSPGYGGNLPRTHLTQIEELASHGYVVVGIIHLDPNTKITSKAIKAALQQRLQDIDYSLATLERLNTSNPFQNYFDLEKIGIFGHSMGGMTAAEVVRLDPRFGAGINLDGPFSRRVVKQRLERPFMLINQYRLSVQKPQKKVYRRACSMMYSVLLKGAAHDAFTDIPFLASLFPSYDFRPLLSPLVPTKGEPRPRRVDPRLTLQSINRYTLAFFDRHLKQQSAALLDQPSTHTSVVYQFRDGSGGPNCPRE